jgi:hypothetical protein
VGLEDRRNGARGDVDYTEQGPLTGPRMSIALLAIKQIYAGAVFERRHRHAPTNNTVPNSTGTPKGDVSVRDEGNTAWAMMRLKPQKTTCLDQ